MHTGLVQRSEETDSIGFIPTESTSLLHHPAGQDAWKGRVPDEYLASSMAGFLHRQFIHSPFDQLGTVIRSGPGLCQCGVHLGWIVDLD